MPPAPRACRRAAFTLFAEQLPRIESLDGLVFAALAISLHEQPRCDPKSVVRQLEALAARVRGRIRSSTADAKLAHAHAVLFDEEQLRGNRVDYLDAKNSYLAHVLESKVGIPISLSLVYLYVLRRLELDVSGVNSPGHFLVRLEHDGKESFVDAFHGGTMHTRTEALAFLALVRGKALDPATALLPATHRQWLYRMLQNLKGSFRAASRQQDHAAMLELEALLHVVPQA